MDEIVTEVVRQKAARAPRARLWVVSGPDRGRELCLDGDEGVVVGSGDGCQLVLTDPTVSRRHLELRGGPDGYRLRDLGSTNGALVDGVQVLEALLRARTRIALGRTELRFEPEEEEPEWPLSRADRFGDALGRTPAMRRVFAMLERASATSAPVLLEGEPGTGKELLARGVHALGPRADGPFAVLEVEAFSPLLLEGELFGRAAPPWAPPAARRPGLLEEARGGTLFVDRIDALPREVQAKLARALDAGPSDVRIIAASARDLAGEVRAGRFREDLFFRLSVVRVRVPALRERAQDVPMLARAFEERMGCPGRLDADAIDRLVRHDWPGNVRELRQVVERARALPGLEAAAASPAFGAPQCASKGPQLETVDDAVLALPYRAAKDQVVEKFERAYVLEQLRISGGVVARAAARSGLPRQSVHRILRRHGLKPVD